MDLMVHPSSVVGGRLWCTEELGRLIQYAELGTLEEFVRLASVRINQLKQTGTPPRDVFSQPTSGKEFSSQPSDALQQERNQQPSDNARQAVVSRRATISGSGRNEAANRRRRSSIFDLLAPGGLDRLVEEDGDGEHIERVVADEERVQQLPAFLKAVWDAPPPPLGLGYPRMYTTLAHALRESDHASDAVDAWSLAWQLDTEAHVVRFVHELAPALQRMQKLARFGLVGRVLLGLVLSYADLVSDLLLAAEHLKQGRTLEGILTLAFPAALLLVHAFLSFMVDRAPVSEVALALLGAKPALDSWRVLAGKAPRTGAALSTGIAYALGRAAEVLVESVPQVVTQCAVMLAGGGGAKATTLQLVALISSFLSVGFVAANCDLDNDTDLKSRRTDPWLIGWMGSGRRKYALLALDTAFLSCTCAAKGFAWASLVVHDPAVFAVWLGAELVLWTVVRSLLVDTYKIFDRRIPLIFNHIWGIFMFFVVHACPACTGRNPVYTTVSPRFYAACSAFAMVDSFVMLRVVEAPNLAWTATSAATSAALVFLAALVALGVPRYRWLWYRHYTLHDHFREYVWTHKMSYTYGPTMEDHRARILEVWRPQYWDEALVRPWLEEGWARWSASPPPVWFTDKWKRKIPAHLLPDGVVVSPSRQWSSRMLNTMRVRSGRSIVVGVTGGDAG